MLAAHQQPIRLLQAVLVASVLVPTILFAYTSWQGYRSTHDAAHRQILQARDALTEHALKVFEGVDRSIGETNEIIRGMNDAAIANGAEQLHVRLKRIAESSSQTKSLWI